MRLSSQTQNNILRPLDVSIIGVDECAIGNASGKLSLILSSKAQLVTNLGAQTIGADQEIGLVAGLGYTTRPIRRKDAPRYLAKSRTVAPSVSSMADWLRTASMSARCKSAR